MASGVESSYILVAGPIESAAKLRLEMFLFGAFKIAEFYRTRHLFNSRRINANRRVRNPAPSRCAYCRGHHVAAVVISGAVAIVVPSLKTTATVTETSNETITTTVTETSKETTIVSMNGTTNSVYVVGGPFMFLTASGSCTADGTWVPCLGGPAYVFNCNGIQNLLAGPPPASQECIQKVTSTMSPYPSANVTITILALTQVRSLPSWTNCEWSVAGTPETGIGAYCIPVNSSASSGSVSFIVGEPAGAPP